MRVLLVNDFLNGGGAEKVFRDTYNQLLAKGVDVEMFYGIENNTLPENLLSYLYNKRTKGSLLQKLEAFKPNIVHIHNYYHKLSPSIFSAIKQYKKNNKAKVVLTAHDYHLICPSSGMTGFKRGRIIRIKPSKNIFLKTLPLSLDHRGFKYSLVKKAQWFLAFKLLRVHRSIDYIISPSFFLKKSFEDSGVKTPIAVIRNPFELQVPKNMESLKPSLKQEVRILFIGRLSQEKGLTQFLKVFCKLGLDGVVLDILGIGNQEKELKKIVKDNDGENVVFHGYKKGEELKRFLIASNVVLLPSILYENAPLSIVEGAAFGNIILARNLGGMTELAKLTRHYFLIDDWGSELSSAIEKIKLIEATNSIKTLSEFSPTNYYDCLMKTYNKAWKN